MKIICLEEHTTDPAINQATHKVVAAEAGYMADLEIDSQGTRADASPADPSPADASYDRPRLVAGKAVMQAASDVGAGRIAAMDQHGIDMQILSYSSSPQSAPAAQAVALARAANDRLAEVARAHPTRFAAFATLPWQDAPAAAAELQRAVQELGMVGTLLTGRPGQGFLDEARYGPVLASLNQLKVPLYVHPGYPLPQVREPYYGGLDKVVSARLSLFGWGWHNEAGIQVIRMILSGVFEKFPDLQVISGHWGEMVPFYLQRMDDAIPQQATGLSRSITDTYRAHVYVTPSGMLNLPHFEFIHKVIGADRILYAVDYPYLTLDGARNFLETLPVSQQDKEKIAYKNAQALLRLP